ncbi:MAG: transposase [Anaerocolumna aminovalerica]|jgi:transposase|uniref:transposase n=1 Tax=Anaerocolumna aminovalerica TaxID=1527 RepID=UPI001C0EAFD1|nr:transposase [Anaerocolumna aminovalerica]MBU5334443.1 transposase [Anaerocolumna aminovalerica]MDU6266465.1 transposase [Anaerocolumna aminovalerica]
MWKPYVDLVHAYFPNTELIIDKYHFIRQVTLAIENERKMSSKSIPASLRKYYKQSHKLILCRYAKLKDDNKRACDLMLLYNDDLRLAHLLKEEFYDISVRIQVFMSAIEWVPKEPHPKLDKEPLKIE